MAEVMARCDTSNHARVLRQMRVFASADRAVFARLWWAATDLFFAFWPSAHWGFVCRSSIPSQQAIARPLARSERCRTRAVLETRTPVLVFRTHASRAAQTAWRSDEVQAPLARRRERHHVPSAFFNVLEFQIVVTQFWKPIRNEVGF